MPVQRLASFFVPTPRQRCDSKIVECLQVIIGMCGNEPYAYQQEIIVKKAYFAFTGPPWTNLRVALVNNIPTLASRLNGLSIANVADSEQAT